MKMTEGNETVQSWKTAIRRNKCSAIVSYLESKRLIVGSILDYGCGRGDDVSYLRKNNYSVIGYDPHWDATDIDGKIFDTILCSYVLNVVDLCIESCIIEDIVSKLSPTGSAFFAVRRDISRDCVTSKGLQRIVYLPFPVIYEKKNSFAIYALRGAESK